MYKAEQYELAPVVSELQPVVTNRTVNVSRKVKRGKFHCPVSSKFKMAWSTSQSNWAARTYLGV